MSKDDEIASVVAAIDGLLGLLRQNVDDLNAIIAHQPEVTGDEPAAT